MQKLLVLPQSTYESLNFFVGEIDDAASEINVGNEDFDVVVY